jgi:Na+-translocating ferredoxin:NAD+ oxidoreductase RnfG subunit
MEAQVIIALVIGTVIMLFVPALVWSTLIAGLYQTVRDKIRKSLAATQRAAASTK